MVCIAVVSQGGFDTDITDAKEGYKGSSQDFGYTSMGHDVDDVELGARRQICACDWCLKGQEQNCLLKRDVGVVRRIRIKMNDGSAARIATRGGNQPVLDAMFERLQANDIVVVRIHRSDRNEQGESYYLAKVHTEPWKLPSAGLFGGVRFSRGWLVLRLKWFEFEREDDAGTRYYDFLNRRPEEYFQLNGIVNIVRAVELERVGGARSQKFKLKYAEHCRIMKYGSLSS